MKNVQNDSSRFEGSLHEMVSKKPFMNQEISYMNGNGEIKLSNVSDYIKSFLSIIKIEIKMCHICYKWKIPFELVSDKLIISI